ncbi:MAG: DUF1440 domain-containing protein [Pyrinomonadaceae bacterium]
MKSSRKANGPDGTDVLKGMAAGFIGGLIASWTMNRFQAFLSKATEATEDDEKPQGGKSSQQGSEGKQKSQSESQGESQESDDATIKTAAAISEVIFDHKLTKSEKEIAGPAVHYAFGAITGGLYGAVTELAPVISTGVGLPFGAVVWLVADEAVVPAVGLSKSPTEYPLSIHAHALASHFVYGLTADIVRRAVRRAL